MAKLTLTVEFTIGEEDASGDSFKLGGDIKPGRRVDIIEHWLRSQMGAGPDKRPANNQNTYHIEIDWNPDGDVFTCRSDCGNKGLRDGILLYVLKKLTGKE